MRKSTLKLAIEQLLQDGAEPAVGADALVGKSETDKLLLANQYAAKNGDTSQAYKAELQRILDTAKEDKVDLGSSGSSSSSSSDSSSDDSSSSDDGDSSGGGDDFGMDDFGGGEDTTDDPESDDDPADDTEDSESPVKEPDSDKKDDTKEDDKKDDKSKKDESAQESLRLTRFIDINKGNIALEFDAVAAYSQASADATEYRTDRVFLDEQPLGEQIVNWAGNKLANLGVFLKDIGIEYGPKILSFLGKAGYVIATESAKAIVTGSNNLKRFLNKKMNSFESLLKEINELHDKVQHFATDNPNAKPSGTYKEEDKIAVLKIGSSTDIPKNLKQMLKFTEVAVINITKLFDNESQTILHLMEMDTTSNKHNMPSLLGAANFSSALKQGTLKGYEPKDDNMISYISDTVGCGDVRIVAHIPDTKIKDIDAIKQAYNNSGMFLGIDLSHAHGANEVQYVDVKQLLATLVSMKDLCTKCITHEQQYKSIDNKINTLGNKLKGFFNSLVNSKDKLSLENTTMDYVYMKLGFINKVYLPCMMDIHEYNIKVLKASINYVHKNMSSLQA